MPQDDEDRECSIMTDGIDHGEGFVCERRVNPTVRNHLDYEWF